MQKMLTQPSGPDLSKSELSKTKKITLFKVLRRSSNASLINPTHKINTQNYSHRQILQENSKTERPLSLMLNQKQIRKFSEVRMKTQTKSNQKNIFNSEQLECLNNCDSSTYQEIGKTQTGKKETDVFRGPIYYSERLFQTIQNPQKQQQTDLKQEIKQEIYKFNKNPKLLKFKVSLKRKNTIQQPSSLTQTKKLMSRFMITQFKTEQSENPSRHNTRLIKTPQKTIQKTTILSNSINYEFTNSNRTKYHSSKCGKVPKLSQNSNLYKSIKTFERKSILLGQIQSQKDLQQKYGKRLFEFFVRDKYKQNQKQNDFVVKIKDQKVESDPKYLIRNKFIRELENDKYNTNFEFKAIKRSLKLKGKPSIKQLN